MNLTKTHRNAGRAPSRVRCERGQGQGKCALGHCPFLVSIWRVIHLWRQVYPRFKAMQLMSAFGGTSIEEDKEYLNWSRSKPWSLFVGMFNLTKI